MPSLGATRVLHRFEALCFAKLRVLTPVMWLKILVLVNPLVYMTEGLRASLTPELPHMPVWAFMLALVGGSVGLGIFSLQTFRRRVVT